MATVSGKFSEITLGEDSGQPTLIPLTTSTDGAIASKINQYRDEITRALNPAELMPLLFKEELLDFSEKSVLLADSMSTYEKSRYLLQCLEAKGPSAYSKFLSCIKAEKSHMGHEYITSLVEEKPFGSKFELEESSRLKEAIQRHYPAMMDISPEALAPLMYSKKLLTEEEKHKLLIVYKTEHERVHLLLHLLDMKGPLAHRLFAECLRSESSHPTHSELYSVLTSYCCSEKTVVSRKQTCPVDERSLANVFPHKEFFQQWRLQGPLKGERYDKMVRVFQGFHHNGEWGKLEIEAAKYEKSSVPEYEIVAYFQKATCSILQNQPETAMQLMGEAKRIVKTKVCGENRSALLGRCECILSRHFQYLKKYEEARQHLEHAKEHLDGIEAGEDSAFVHYCEASLTVECLSELSTKQDFERVDGLFARAICDDRSHESGMGLFVLHSLLRLAQMYLGSTHHSPGKVKDIKRARNCLNAITYSSLPERSKCIYNLMESDLHRNCGRIDKAKESLQIVLSISKEHNFKLEISPAQTRMQSLSTNQA